MPNKLYQFTAEAYNKMKDRLDFLTLQRVEVLERLKIAREMGDLSENGAYRYAKFELGNIGREMRRLKHLLEQGEITSRTIGPHIGFGSLVTLLHGEKTLIFMLVGEHESDPKQNKLSMKSPLGQALIGKTTGDTMEISTPSGQQKYQVKQVE